MVKYIACLGSGSDVMGMKMYKKMERVGELLAKYGCVVVTGGFGGSGMEAPAKGARSIGGITQGFIFNKKLANPYMLNEIDYSDAQLIIDKKIFLHISVEKQYGLRLGSLMEADGFIIADNDPTPGTLVEFCAILNMQQKFWKKQKPVAILVSERGSLKIMELIINKFFPNNTFILPTSSPDQAVGWVE